MTKEDREWVEELRKLDFVQHIEHADIFCDKCRLLRIIEEQEKRVEDAPEKWDAVYEDEKKEKNGDVY